jgi:hypothetical protein
VSAPDRGAYAERQAQLLDALLRGDDPPPGFVAVQADAAGDALRRKRGRAVAHAWPALALSLGDAFAARFDAFARDGGVDASAEPLRDGLAFARWVAAADGAVLDDDARVEVLLARAALRRRGPWARVARLRHPHARLLAVARLPFVGTVVGRLRLSREPDLVEVGIREVDSKLGPERQVI